MDRQDLSNDSTKESRLDPGLKKADRCGVNVQPLHTDLRQNMSLSLCLFICVLIVLLTCNRQCKDNM